MSWSRQRFCNIFHIYSFIHFILGSQILLEKLQRFKPKIAVFNGKLIFEVFSGKKDFTFGRQPELVDGTNTVRNNFIIVLFIFLDILVSLLPHFFFFNLYLLYFIKKYYQ